MSAIDALRPGESAADTGPGSVSGLRAIRRGDRVSWQFRYYEGGKRRTRSLGPYPDVTLSAARKEARKIAGRRAEGRQTVTDRTLSDVWDEFIRLERGRLSERTLGDYRSTWKCHLSGLASLRLSSLTGQHAISLHSEMVGGGHPFKANRVASLLSTLWNFAERMEWVERGRNPAMSIRRAPEPERKRTLSRDELDRLIAAIEDAEAHGTERLCDIVLVLMLLYAGRRVWHVRELKWGQVDLDAGTIEMGDPKGERLGRKKPIVRPQLSPPILSRLRALPRGADGDWVFPSKRDPTKHVHDARGPWGRLKAAAKLPDDAKLYCLKATGSTIARDRGFTGEKITSHQGTSDKETTLRRYAHESERQAREVADAIAEEVGLGELANVVPIRRKA